MLYEVITVEFDGGDKELYGANTVVVVGNYAYISSSQDGGIEILSYNFV